MEEIYIVTGALGHLGSTIIRELIASNKKVRGFDLKQVRNNNLSDIKIDMIYGDITNKTDIEKLLDVKEETIYVIHCAGIVSIASKYDERVYNVNVNGTKNIVDACLNKKVKKLVHVSSVHAIPEGKTGEVIREVNHFNPDEVKGLYAKTKAEASEYVLNSVKKGLNASIVHPSGIIGPYDYGNGHLTRMFIDYLNKKLTAIVPGGYDFVDVRDVAIGTINCVKKGKKGECYILSNHYYEAKELIKLASEISKTKNIKTILPLWFAKLVAPLAELYYKIRKTPPLYTSYSLYTLKSNALFSHDKATKELDYMPRDIRETITDIITFIKENNLK